MAHTAEYAELLKQTRAEYPGWGHSRRHAPIVRALLPSGSVLDYGSGGSDLPQALAPEFVVTNYDPSMPEHEVLPDGKFSVVVCTHVLEHIEPELLDATLSEIVERAEQFIYIEVPHNHAVEILPDGRNAHLIVESRKWWLEKLSAAFAGWTLTTMRNGRPPSTQFIYANRNPKKSAP